MLTLMVLNIILSNCSYMIVAPFMPLEFESKGITTELVGIIFAAYPVGVIVLSPIIGKMIEFTGRKCWIVGGLFSMGLIFIIFGLLQKLSDPRIIFVIALIARFLQGCANAGVQTTCYSIATVDYPD
jgi:MFS family permease